MKAGKLNPGGRGRPARSLLSKAADEQRRDAAPGEARAFSNVDGRRSTSRADRGLFAAVIAVAIIFLLINPHFANPNLAVSILRSMSSWRLWRWADPRHRRRRDRSVVRRDVWPCRQCAGGDLGRSRPAGLSRNPADAALAVCVGTFNGFLVTTLNIPSFIVTLGSYNLLYGLSLWVSNSGTFNLTTRPPARICRRPSSTSHSPHAELW